MTLPRRTLETQMPRLLDYPLLEAVDDVLRSDQDQVPAFWDLDNVPVELLPFVAHTLQADLWTDEFGPDVERDLIKRAWLFHRFRGTKFALDQYAEATGVGYLFNLIDENDVSNGPDAFTAIDFFILSPIGGISAPRLDALARGFSRLLPARLSIQTFSTFTAVGTSTRLYAGTYTRSIIEHEPTRVAEPVPIPITPPVQSSDASLSSLTLSGLVLAFDTATLTYAVAVINTIDETTVTVTPTDADATAEIALGGVVDADGTIDLAVGANVITITVTAEDGTDQVYTITVTRAAAMAVLTEFQALAAEGAFVVEVTPSGNLVDVWEYSPVEGTLLNQSPAGMFTDDSIFWLERFRIQQSGTRIQIHNGDSQQIMSSFAGTWTDDWGLYIIDTVTKNFMLLQANDGYTAGGAFVRWDLLEWTLTDSQLTGTTVTGFLTGLTSNTLVLAISPTSTYRPPSS